MPDFERDPMEELRDLAAEAGRRAERLPGHQVRALGARRHRRRMVASVAAASVAVVVVAGGAFAAAGQLLSASPTPPATTPSGTPDVTRSARESTPAPTLRSPALSPRPSPPRSPSDSPSASPRPAPAPTAGTTPDALAETTPETPAGTAPESPSSSPDPRRVTEIPADFPLAVDMRPGGGDFTEPTRSDRRSTPWSLDPCTPTAYPTDADRRDFRTVEQHGPEYGDVRQLGLYPDEATAREVVAGFRRVLDACAVEPLDGDPRYESRWETRPLDAGAEGLLAVVSYHFRDGQVPGAGYVGVARVGNAVLLVSRAHEGLPERGVEDGTSREVRGLAALLAEEMCVFAEDGC